MKIAVAGATGLVGSQVTALARAQGHEVVELTRGTGFDLLNPDDRLREALTGAAAVVDVTSSPSVRGDEAQTFFTTVAENLGRAATAAGVQRTVVLSIVGTDLSPDFPYYVAKVAQEQAYRAHAPGVLIVRATQFHEFPIQTIDWYRQGDVVYALDVPTQPVATAEIAALLVSAAVGEVAGDVDLAGPQPERLVDLARRYGEHVGSEVRVEAVPGPASMAAGSMLPQDGALLRGRDWATWLAAQPTTVRS
jgi:uncharacterized protein YbjT (DUF2867 family)